MARDVGCKFVCKLATGGCSDISAVNKVDFRVIRCFISSLIDEIWASTLSETPFNRAVIKLSTES